MRTLMIYLTSPTTHLTVFLPAPTQKLTQYPSPPLALITVSDRILASVKSFSVPLTLRIPPVGRYSSSSGVNFSASSRENILQKMRKVF